MYQLSIVIATRNSSGYIEEHLHRIHDEVSSHIDDIQYIIVIDGGEVEVVDKVLSFKKYYPHLKLISLDNNYGQQAAIQTGIEYADGNNILTFDDDLQYHPREIPKLYDALQRLPEKLIINGYSSSRNHASFYSKTSVYTSWIIENIFFRSYRNVHYLTSLKIFRRRLFYKDERWLNVNVYFFWEIMPEVMDFVVVEHHPRQSGNSGYSLIQYLMFFRHIILRITNNCIIVFLFIWSVIAWFALTLNTFVSVVGIMLLALLTNTCLLAKIRKHKVGIKSIHT